MTKTPSPSSSLPSKKGIIIWWPTVFGLIPHTASDWLKGTEEAMLIGPGPEKVDPDWWLFISGEWMITFYFIFLTVVNPTPFPLPGKAVWFLGSRLLLCVVHPPPLLFFVCTHPCRSLQIWLSINMQMYCVPQSVVHWLISLCLCTRLSTWQHFPVAPAGG